jgi:hypothetical protein
MRKLLLAVLVLPAAAHAQTALPLPPGYPTLLGVSCGGVALSSFVTGFDSSGIIHGAVYAWTRCGGSGRGGGYQSHTYTSWNSIEWDLYSNYKLLPYDGSLPNPGFSAVDQWGNYISSDCSGSTNGVAACKAEALISYIPPGYPPIAVTVPNLYGVTASQAKSTLTNDGLVESSYRATSSVSFNHVCGQSPAAGTVVDPGSTVSVCLSNGPGGN